MPNLNFFDNYLLMAVSEEIVPQQSFFRSRYFPTGAGDIFAADKVLTEYRKGDRKMAAFVSRRIGDIPMERQGYDINEYRPAYIAPSRSLSVDDLAKRGFGEALYSGSTQEQRAIRLLAEDMADMERRIALREEWMAAQTMINNACTMQTYIDNNTMGEKEYVQFFNGDTSEHIYTVASANKWDGSDGNIRADVRNMCKMLSRRGLPALDLVLGTDAADCMLEDAKIREKLNTTSGVIVGQVYEQLSGYSGVVFMGQLNFGGFNLNVFSVDETYVDENDQEQAMFPATSAMVSAPGCGHLMYGQITQIDYGQTEPTTHTGIRVPKLVVDQPNDIRKLRLGTRPLAAPKSYCPYIYAADVVG